MALEVQRPAWMSSGRPAPDLRSRKAEYPVAGVRLGRFGALRARWCLADQTRAIWPKSVEINHAAARSIRHGALRRWFVHGNGSMLHPAHAERIKQILDLLDAARPPEHLSAPTYPLNPLKGDRRGQWPVRADRAGRTVFLAKGKDALDVNLIDYQQ